MTNSIKIQVYERGHSTFTFIKYLIQDSTKNNNKKTLIKFAFCMFPTQRRESNR